MQLFGKIHIFTELKFYSTSKMARKIACSLIVFLLLALALQSCKAGKGCGCRTNMNHYDPKKGR
jgi:hypothetical protein